MINKYVICVFLVLVAIACIHATTSDCELPKDNGSCAGEQHSRIHSYYFDIKTRECNPFLWSGCGGNGNRFYSQEECHFACSYYLKL